MVPVVRGGEAGPPASPAGDASARDTDTSQVCMTADPRERLAEFLSVGDSRQNLPGVKIRDAATMLLVDRTGHVPKVLLGRRHHGHKFMPGKYVFPGGRVELTDRRMSAATPLDRRVEARLMKEVRRPS